MSPDRPLPRDVDEALARIAAGRGRKPTAAHPACLCTANGIGLRHDGPVLPKNRRACPVHNPPRGDEDAARPDTI